MLIQAKGDQKLSQKVTVFGYNATIYTAETMAPKTLICEQKK